MADAMLDCVLCGGRKWQTLDVSRAEELRSTGATRGQCETCKRETYWKVSDYGRRSGKDRRSYDEVKPQTVDPSLGIERITLAPPPNREQYRHAGAQIVMQERRAAADRRQALNRTNGRVPLSIPVRIRVHSGGLHFDEVTETVNVSRTGVYIKSQRPYQKGVGTQVTLHYSPVNPGMGIEQPGTVVRIDHDPDMKFKGVAIVLSVSQPMPAYSR
jgi:hypothetical protein